MQIRHRYALLFTLCLGAFPALGETLSLSQAEALLLEANPEIAFAKAMKQSTEAGVAMAGARPNPTLSYAVNSINPATVSKERYWQKNMDHVVRVEQTFERGNKRDLRLQAASQAVEASAADLNDTIRQARLNLAQIYTDVLAAQETRLAAKENAELAARTLRIAELRLKAGDISSADAARVRADMGRVQNEAVSAALSLDKARIELSSLLGNRLPAKELQVQSDWPELSRIAPVTDFRIVDERADVLAAKNRLKQAEAVRDLARAQRTRDVTVGLQYEHFPPDAGKTYGVSLSIPLFIGNDYRGDIARGEADYSAAEIAYQRTRINAAMEVARLEAEYSAAQTRYLTVRDQVLPAAEKAAKAAELAFQHGAIGLTDFLDAGRSLRAARQEAIFARAETSKVWHTYRLSLPRTTP